MLIHARSLSFFLLVTIASLGAGAAPPALAAEAEEDGAEEGAEVEVDYALSAGDWRRELGIAFVAGFAQGELEGDADYGFSLFGGLGPPNLPIVLGVDLSVLIRGEENENLGETEFTTLDLSVSSDIVMLHAVIRVQPATGRFRPFLDAAIGFKAFSTRSRLAETQRYCPPDFECELDSKSKINNSDVALSYGLGAGADIRVYQHLRIFVAGRYLFGEKATHVVPSSVSIEGNTVRLRKARTRTDLITTQLGFSVVF
jgi:opacity protein-like surface antigen